MAGARLSKSKRLLTIISSLGWSPSMLPPFFLLCFTPSPSGPPFSALVINNRRRIPKECLRIVKESRESEKVKIGINKINQFFCKKTKSGHLVYVCVRQANKKEDDEQEGNRIKGGGGWGGNRGGGGAGGSASTETVTFDWFNEGTNGSCPRVSININN